MGIIKTSGTNLDILGSTSAFTSSCITVVETNHQKIRFNKYFKPDLE
jgi:hypothetical protein